MSLASVDQLRLRLYLWKGNFSGAHGRYHEMFFFAEAEMAIQMGRLLNQAYPSGNASTG
jgi:hypothetical protein